MIVDMGLRTFTASVALLIVAVTSSCGGESSQSAVGEPADFAYMVAISGERDSVEWVAPGPGWWRRTGRDVAGCVYEFVRAEDRYSTRVSCNPPGVRIGSPEFLGDIDLDSISLALLRGRREISVGDELYVQRGDRRYVLTITDRIPLAAARARGLFAVSTKGARLIERELEPGTPPTTALRAYWFGPSIGRWTAVTAVQREWDEDLYESFYELPSAEGRSSATGKPPEGEIRVVSAPLESPQVATALDSYRRKPFQRIVLADGEEATLFPKTGEGIDRAFAVKTRTTLVAVIGPVPRSQVLRFAVQLRPL
jgi:hypothetical protein